MLGEGGVVAWFGHPAVVHDIEYAVFRECLGGGRTTVEDAAWGDSGRGGVGPVGGCMSFLPEKCEYGDCLEEND